MKYTEYSPATLRRKVEQIREAIRQNGCRPARSRHVWGIKVWDTGKVCLSVPFTEPNGVQNSYNQEL